MSVTFGTLGTSLVATAPTTIDVALPTGIVAGHLLVLMVAHKHATAPIASAPAGWTPHPGSAALGGLGAQGSSSGIAHASVFTRVAQGAESGTVPVTLPATTSAVGARIFRAATDAGAFSIAFASGVDTTPDAAWSITAGDLDVGAGDLVVAVTAVNSQNSTFATEVLTQAGVTFGSETERSEAGTSGIRLVVSSHQATVGKSTGVPTYSAVATGAASNQPCGVTVLMRIRGAAEVSTTPATTAWSCVSPQHERQLAPLPVASSWGVLAHTVELVAIPTPLSIGWIGLSAEVDVSFDTPALSLGWRVQRPLLSGLATDLRATVVGATLASHELESTLLPITVSGAVVGHDLSAEMTNDND